MAQEKAIVLLSGGLDSATCLAIARSEGFEPYPLSFQYGQRHAVELQAAERVAKAQGVIPPRIAEIDLAAFGGSALTSDMAVPRDRSDEEMQQGIPVTYVPARNTIFLSYALAFAEVIKARDIFIGVNALDYSGYPDCRPAFIGALETAFNLGSKIGSEGGKITIHTPLIALTKAEIIQWGASLKVDYAPTVSCYDPDRAGRACGRCDACRLRRKGFHESGIADPTVYQ